MLHETERARGQQNMDGSQTRGHVRENKDQETQSKLRADIFNRQAVYINMRIPKIRYFIGIPYLYFIASMGGNILWEAMVLGIVCAMTDFFLEGGGKPPLQG